MQSAELKAGDIIFVMRETPGANPHAMRQFARVLKHGLRIHGLRCIDFFAVGSRQ